MLDRRLAFEILEFDPKRGVLARIVFSVATDVAFTLEHFEHAGAQVASGSEDGVLLRSLAVTVVVQIFGGILLGPGVLGAVFPDYYAFVFKPDVIIALNGVAWWAVMLFVWVAGIELDLSAAWKHRGETGITAGLALGVPLVAGSIAAAVILQFPGWRGPNGQY